MAVEPQPEQDDYLVCASCWERMISPRMVKQI
jgi:hypothetical protein